MTRKTGIVAALGVLALAISPGWALGYTLTVKNNCSYDLLVRGASDQSVLSPDNQTLLATSGATVHQATYDVSPPWTAGRVYGCWDPSAANFDISHGQNGYPMQQRCGLSEVTVSGGGNLFSNISFVDFISTPMKLEASGGAACTNNGVVNGYFDPTKVTGGCPTKLLNGRACMSAFRYCTDAQNGNPGSDYCKVFDGPTGAIAKCQADPTSYPGCVPGGAARTSAVYGCESQTFWAEGGHGQQYCMAINRGILTEPAWPNNQADPSKFYPAGAAYNTYAKFVHDTAGPIFALSYDDYPSGLDQGGYLNCQTSTGWTITFCPEPAGQQAALFLGVAKAVGTANSEDNIQIEGDFRPEREIDLRLESVLLEALMAEPGDTGDELAAGAGPTAGRLPVRLVRRPGADEDKALFETAAGVTPKARLRIRRAADGTFAFSLSASRISISAADVCVGLPRNGAAQALLRTRFRLETAGVEVAAEEPWRCGPGHVYRTGTR